MTGETTPTPDTPPLLPADLSLSTNQPVHDVPTDVTPPSSDIHVDSSLITSTCTSHERDTCTSTTNDSQLLSSSQAVDTNEVETNGVETNGVEANGVEANGVDSVEVDEETISKFNLDEYKSVEELEQVGPHLLKVILQRMSLKCGGTLRERAVRLMSIKGVPLDQIDTALFASKTNGRRKNKGRNGTKSKGNV